MKKLKINKKILVPVLAVVIVTAVVCQVVYDVNTYNDRFSGQLLISSMIDTSINNLLTPAPVDAQTGDVYLPNYKLMLPAPKNFNQETVEYSDFGGGTPMDLQISSKNITGIAENQLLLAQSKAVAAHESGKKVTNAVLDQVPGLQACVRGVQIFSNKQSSRSNDFNLQFTKKLNDGRTIYGYTETTCKSILMPDFVSYVKQIQSY